MVTRDVAPDDRYETIEGHLERDRDTVIGIWRGHIGWQDQLERMYDVFYLGCPFGRPLLRLLRHRASGEIVGTIGLGPRPMFWQGRELRAAVISHFAVMPEHRSLKPALGLSQAMMAVGREHFEFIYGLTNAQGGAIAKRARFAVPGHLVRHVRVLRYRHYVQRVLPAPLARVGGAVLDGVLAAGHTLAAPMLRTGLHVTWSETVDPRMQSLWERSEHGDSLCTVRDTAMLAWRFLGLPAECRRFLLVSTAPGAPLLAWFACETNVRVPGFLTVTDAWFGGGVHEADRRAIRELCRAGYDAGYEAIETRLTAARSVLDAWRAEGFVTRGEQPFFVQDLDARSNDDIAAGMHITSIEQDG